MWKLLSSYLASERGAVYVVMLGTSLACFGFIGLMFDAGRIFIEHTRLQHFADRIALAAAVELDGKADAIERARLVIDSTVLTQRAIYTSGDGQDFSVDSVRFFSRDPYVESPAPDEAEAGSGETDKGQEARYVAVQAKPRRLSWSLLGQFSVSLADMQFGAEAIASSSGTTTTGDLEFMFAVDVSQSMLMGATAEDHERLEQLQGCVFACHIKYEKDGVPHIDDPLGESSGSYPNPDGDLQTRYEHALENGVRFRLSAAEDALNRALALIGQLQHSTRGEIAVDVRTFARDLSPESILEDRPALNGLLMNAERLSLVKLDVFQPGPAVNFSHENDHTTDPEVVFEQLARDLDNKLLNKQPGDKLLLTILTDGVAGYVRGDSGFRRVFHPDECNILKGKGVDIAVIYLEYLPVDRFDSHVSGSISDIEPSLRTCATEDLFFKTTFEEDIFAAFEQLLQPISGADARTRLVR